MRAPLVLSMCVLSLAAFPSPPRVHADCGPNTRPFGLSCIPETALWCAPYAADKTAMDCSFANGLWRIQQTGGRMTIGTGTDHTIYWRDGCEMPYLTIDQPIGAQPIDTVSSLWVQETTAARVDGSELFEFPGWGTLELWPGEASVRAGWARAAPARDTKGAFLRVEMNGPASFVVSYVREDKLAFCAWRFPTWAGSTPRAQITRAIRGRRAAVVLRSAFAVC
jgi:hypothetical protein